MKKELEEKIAHTKTVYKKDLDRFLKCYLCTGFFRDAHTINECLCSFCKVCIYRYFIENPKEDSCPRCKAPVSLGGKPLKNVVCDQTI